MITPGVYRERIAGRFVADAERKLQECDDVYPDPVTFLKEWKRGYDENVGTVHAYGYPGGFEMYLVSLDPADSYHILPFERWKGIDEWGKVDHFFLAADLGNICDVRNQMRLVVNDIPSQRVLVYKPQEYVSRQNRAQWGEGLLLENESAYTWVAKYPFDSVNPLKAANNQWSLVGFSPAELYDALRETGFRFPK